MTTRCAAQRMLTLLCLIILALQVEECGKKAQNKESSAAAIPDSLKRYPFRSAIIELKYSGSASGRQTIYIDDFGLKEASVDSLTMKMMDMELPNYKLHIRNRDSVYGVDFVRGVATKGVSPVSAGDEKAISSMGEEMAKGMGMKKQDKDEIVAGQKCAIWASEEMGVRTWLWNNITLKSESRIGDDKIFLNAVSVQTDVPVAPEHFIPPDGFHYTTQEEIERMMDNLDKKTPKEREGQKGKSE